MIENRKTPPTFAGGVREKIPAITYSRATSTSIGPGQFNGRVRNGNEFSQLQSKARQFHLLFAGVFRIIWAFWLFSALCQSGLTAYVNMLRRSAVEFELRHSWNMPVPEEFCP
jgi:hypothetical protein